MLRSSPVIQEAYWWAERWNPLRSEKLTKYFIATHPNLRTFPEWSVIGLISTVNMNKKKTKQSPHLFNACKWHVFLVAQCSPSLTLGPLHSNTSMGPPGTATFTLSASKSLPTSKFPVWSSRAKARKITWLIGGSEFGIDQFYPK